MLKVKSDKRPKLKNKAFLSRYSENAKEKMPLIFYYIFFVVLLQMTILGGSACAQSRPQPELSTGSEVKQVAHGKEFMIVTANPHATKAGYDILKRGGTAADAAIAAQLVLGLVEPQSSGLGGGAFALYYHASTKTLTTYDARETAPFLAGPFHFYQNGQPMKWQDAMMGGRSVGTPSVPALLTDLHQNHGQATWMELFEEAIDLSQNGFSVSPRMAKMVAAHANKLSQDPAAAAYFLPKGQPVKSGDLLKNPAYAETLKNLAFYNTKNFYKGQSAQKIVNKVQNITTSPGLLTLRDFAQYKVKLRPPLCAPYRKYIICAMGEPSSGGLTMLQILGMLERFNLPIWGANNPKSWHVIAEASRLAFADRALYMADPDFVKTPNVALLDPKYIKQRAASIKDTAMETPSAGIPPTWTGPLYEKGQSLERPGTSHISVIDKYGNALSMTTTIESAFGAHIMVDGYLLNNQLTDFSFKPFGADNKTLVANMIEGGKRPRSSMTPAIVFDQAGAPVLIIGSAGGSRIIGYVLQRIIAVLDWGMDIQEALAMPHLLARSDTIEQEDDVFARALKAKGHTVKIGPLNSGLTAIHITEDTLKAAADPRREGIGMGQ